VGIVEHRYLLKNFSAVDVAGPFPKNKARQRYCWPHGIPKLFPPLHPLCLYLQSLRQKWHVRSADGKMRQGIRFAARAVSR
jgi:hypothetical protein